MSEKILFAHAGSGNHGCEAIVRSTAGLIGNDITLYSANPDQDVRYGVDAVVSEIRSDKDTYVKRFSLPWFVSRVQTKLAGSISREIYYRKKAMIDSVEKGDICFSIGGDNYCYAGTDILAAQHRLLKKKGAKTILWGCSVEPELLKIESIARDLAMYDLIVARESISYEALKAVNENTVLVPDPAFTLEREDLPLPEGWIEGKMVGINASPLILQSGSDGELVLDAYRKLIETIIEKTDLTVALIPHVVWETNDDRLPLGILYDEFRDSGRVIMIEDHNASQLKGYIARCRMFIGARTHATIAAYSTCVPTLVLGYSVKSRGIARDLFGSEENYVLPVQGMKDAGELARGFQWLLENEEGIREYLFGIMGIYKEKAYGATVAIKNIEESK